MAYKITVIPGDGIGKEITDSAVEVMKKVAEKFKLDFEYTYKDAGGTAYDKFFVLCDKSTAAFFGSGCFKCFFSHIGKHRLLLILYRYKNSMFDYTMFDKKVNEKESGNLPI